MQKSLDLTRSALVSSLLSTNNFLFFIPAFWLTRIGIEKNIVELLLKHFQLSQRTFVFFSLLFIWHSVLCLCWRDSQKWSSMKTWCYIFLDLSELNFDNYEHIKKVIQKPWLMEQWNQFVYRDSINENILFLCIFLFS